jgi:hypothetical protein
MLEFSVEWMLCTILLMHWRVMRCYGNSDARRAFHLALSRLSKKDSSFIFKGVLRAAVGRKSNKGNPPPATQELLPGEKQAHTNKKKGLLPTCIFSPTSIRPEQIHTCTRTIAECNKPMTFPYWEYWPGNVAPRDEKWASVAEKASI